MIWLFLNLWWVVPALIALVIGVALATGVGFPVIREVSRRYPGLAISLGVVVAVSFSASWLVGYGERRCQSAYEAAEKRLDAKADRVAERSQEAADSARKDIRKESNNAQAEARVIIRTLPASCPAQPVRLRELGEQAVEGARGEVLPAQGR